MLNSGVRACGELVGHAGAGLVGADDDAVSAIGVEDELGRLYLLGQALLIVGGDDRVAARPRASLPLDCFAPSPAPAADNGRRWRTGPSSATTSSAPAKPGRSKPRTRSASSAPGWKHTTCDSRTPSSSTTAPTTAQRSRHREVQPSSGRWGMTTSLKPLASSSGGSTPSLEPAQQPDRCLPVNGRPLRFRTAEYVFFYAASRSFRYSMRTSRGGRYPFAP
jgi:hypothetical protein